MRKVSEVNMMSSDEEIRRILSSHKTVAVVGMSKDPHKDSRRVAAYLKGNGYRIIPVNPTAASIMGMIAYPSLDEIPDESAREIEIVDVFRRSEDVSPVIDQAIRLRQRFGKLRVVWMQLGIVNIDAAAVASRAGLTVVMDRCMAKEHRRLMGRSSATNAS